jgi:hypothetical protein
MPIRFRCPHCGQLMGIARRKAGSRVQCTSCTREVLVPTSDDPRVPEAPAPTAPVASSSGGSAANDPFERDDLAELFQSAPPATVATASNSAAPTAFAPSGDPATVDAAWSPESAGVSELPQPGERSPSRKPASESVGLILSPLQATILTVVLIVLLALSFLVGLLIGRFAL